MIWNEPEDQHWKNRKVYSENVLWFLYFQNLGIAQIEKDHSWPCFDQDIGLHDFQLNYPMTIRKVAYRLSVVPLAELMASLTWKMKSALNHVLQRAHLTALAFAFREVTDFLPFVQESLLWDRSLPKLYLNNRFLVIVTTGKLPVQCSAKIGIGSLPLTSFLCVYSIPKVLTQAACANINK